MKNINTFSHAKCLKNNDPRKEKYRQQRKERGFDDSELWLLDYTIISFTLPRLKVFKEYTQSYPVYKDDKIVIETYEQWQAAIEKMIVAMEKYLVNSWDEEAVEGIDLFLKLFRELWS